MSILTDDERDHLARGLLRRWQSAFRQHDPEDRWQLVHLAICEAEWRFDPERCTVAPWVTIWTDAGQWLSRRWKHEQGSTPRARARRAPLRYARSLDAPLTDSGDSTLADLIGAPDEGFALVERRLDAAAQTAHRALPAAPVVRLSRRQHQLVRLLLEGRTAPVIATRLGISHGNVRVHLHLLCRRLGVARREDIPRRVRELGIPS
jgi:DNA-binding CsgD family transcriptional regulator